MADDGINGAFVTVPTVSLRRADGLAILGQLAGGVNADIGVDLSILAGADALGRARVYAPFPVAGGSSISHYDTVAFRNLLMEPAINPDLRHRLKAPHDLTFELLHDVGWTEPDADGDGYADDEDCNPNSDRPADDHPRRHRHGRAEQRVLGGCTMTDEILQLKAASRNQATFLSALGRLTNLWKSMKLITTAQRAAILAAAAKLK